MAAYSFNEGTGLTTADISGHSRTMTLNGASWEPSGHTGTAITNMTSNAGAQATFTGPSTAITIMAWVKPLDLTASGSRPVVGFVDNGNSTACAIWAERGDFGTPNVLQGNIRTGATLHELAGSAMTLNTWAHVALTYNGSVAILYKDGAVVTSLATTGSVGQGDQLYAAGWVSGSYLAGVTVDDVRVYNTALDATQVKYAMNTPVV